MLDMVNRNPTADDLRKFAWTIIVGLSVIGGLFWLVWWWRGADGRWIALALSVLGIVAGGTTLIAPPSVGRILYLAWMLGGAGIGSIVLPIFMTIVFIILLPAFTLIRFKDPLRYRLKTGDSYWEPHTPHEPSLERMRRPF